MRILVTKEFEFDSAHYLPGYDGDCQRMHGHRYVLQIGVLGTIDEKTGMVMDFKKLKKAVCLDLLDHICLNEVDLDAFPKDLPTAENMVEWFVGQLSHGMGLEQYKDAELAFVRLYETPTSYAEWRKAYDE